MTQTKSCDKCGSIYPRNPRYSQKQWDISHFCSPECAVRKFEVRDQKPCTRCGVTKPVADFNIYFRAGVKRPFSKCRQCEAERHLELRQVGYFKEKDARLGARRAAKYPEKVKAVAEVGRAIRAGILVRPSICEACNSEPKPFLSGRITIEGHHEDYSKPLEVNWLCHPCHIKRHRQLRAA